MTYGLDECRRCGKPIRQKRDVEGAGDMRPSRMPEAEWRAAGFKAQPTLAQLHHPQLGCCTDCNAILMRKRWKPGLRIAITFGLIIGLGILIIWVAETFIP